MRQGRMVWILFILLLAAYANAADLPGGVQARIASSGKTVLADAKGMTLYTYDPDAQGKSNCNGNCARNWPPLAAPANAAPMEEWTVVTRNDQSKQWAYRGKPLYTYVNDSKPGDTTGDGVGNVWHIAMVGSEGQQADSGSPSSSQQQSYGYGEESNAPGARPHYPGLPPSKEKLEAQLGSYRARFYGTVLLNIAATDRPIFGQDLPLWALPSTGTVTYPDGSVGSSRNNHDLIFTMRQSVLGVTINPANPSANGWNPSVLVETDFFGTRPVDTSQPLNRVLDQPRLRLAYVQLEHNGLKIVAGQDKMILSPLDPISLSHVAAPLGATAGDLWGWFPQVRMDLSRKIGNTGMLFQFGILKPEFGDPRLEIPAGSTTIIPPSTSIDVSTSGLGARTTQPFYQARLAVSPKIDGRTATLGIAGHFGQEKVGVNNTLQSWALAFDLDVPISSRIILRGEGFEGSNLIPFQGGVDQGAAVLALSTTSAVIQRIGSAGGWAELTLLPTLDGRNAVYLGAGTDDPKKRNLLPGSTRDKNSFVWASYFHKLTDSVTLALEWSNWQFQTVTFDRNVPGRRGPTGAANAFNLSLAYQF